VPLFEDVAAVEQISADGALPGYSEYMRFSVRSSVDLPHPDGR
jgi:hypothetical protein